MTYGKCLAYFAALLFLAVVLGTIFDASRGFLIASKGMLVGMVVLFHMEMVRKLRDYVTNTYGFYRPRDMFICISGLLATIGFYGTQFALLAQNYTVNFCLGMSLLVLVVYWALAGNVFAWAKFFDALKANNR
jgi:hypothetical protein